ncbi:MAG: hypothetical protein ACE37B_21265 [Ilumatobacter sp.]|jgi:hypothetical protein|uniref:hypothetical protein n=1 Tax=Ilumatobacter sp. TaxID=1967498 RepID=UPI00391B0451
MQRRFIPALAVVAVLGAACGGSDSDADAVNEELAEIAAEAEAALDEIAADAEGQLDDLAADADSALDDATDTPADEVTDAPAGEGLVADLPQFTSEFSRVCDTQVGFGGATPLSDGAGPRPVMLMQESDSGLWIDASFLDLPAGWTIEQDSNFDDNSEFVAIELIACAKVVAQTPNGVQCELEADEGEVIPLDLVDITYEMTVYEATTGEVVGTETIEAADTECPFFVFVDEGQTEYYNTPDATQYTNALKAYVAP